MSQINLAVVIQEVPQVRDTCLKLLLLWLALRCAATILNIQINVQQLCFSRMSWFYCCTARLCYH
jgi:hypothetical protein